MLHARPVGRSATRGRRLACIVALRPRALGRAAAPIARAAVDLRSAATTSTCAVVVRHLVEPRRHPVAAPFFPLLRSGSEVGGEGPWFVFVVPGSIEPGSNHTEVTGRLRLTRLVSALAVAATLALAGSGIITGTAVAAVTYGSNGADTIDALGGAAFTVTLTESGVITGTAGGDVLFGASGDDSLTGEDRIHGEEGDGTLNGQGDDGTWDTGADVPATGSSLIGGTTLLGGCRPVTGVPQRLRDDQVLQDAA